MGLPYAYGSAKVPIRSETSPYAYGPSHTRIDLATWHQKGIMSGKLLSSTLLRGRRYTTTEQFY